MFAKNRRDPGNSARKAPFNPPSRDFVGETTSGAQNPLDRWTRSLKAILAFAVVAVAWILPQPDAFAQFPVIQSFKASTAASWVLGGNAKLTSGGIDPVGSGWLRLTDALNNQGGFAYYNTAFAATQGFVIDFDYATYGGNGADGISFFLFDGTTTTFNLGALGGGLGYTNNGTTVNGLSNAYLGIGIDEYGNYSNPGAGLNGGPGFRPDAVAIRGPGAGTTGYAFLTGTGTLSFNLASGARPTSTADANYRHVSLRVIPSGSSYVINVSINHGGTVTSVISNYVFPTAPPSTLKLGFAASTGGLNNVHEIQNLAVLLPPGLYGNVFEDVNYGGGAGRSRATSAGVFRPKATVELYNSAGTFVKSVLTDAAGNYFFETLADNVTALPTGNYTIRVVNSTVKSSRPGGGSTEVAVQTYRTNGVNASFSGLPDVNRVGGENPVVSDAAAAASGTVIDPATGKFTSGISGQAQSIVTVSLGSSPIQGLDFGYNFDTIVNTNDAGQGSLRQFILNSNVLTNAGLAQSGNRKDKSNANVALVAGVESSIFMIPNVAGAPGLRNTLANQLSPSGVAIITPLTALPAITDSNTSVDGTTQTANVGSSNLGTLGTGGFVGVDALTLDLVQRPEVQITGTSAVGIGLDVQATSGTVRGVSIYGFGSSVNNDTSADIRVGKFSGALIESNMIGTTAISFADPASARSGGDHVRLVGATNGVIQNNLIAFGAGKGIAVEAASNGYQILDNEIANNSLTSNSLDGIDLENSGTATVTGNLIYGNRGVGIDGFQSLGSNVSVNNTVTGNGTGTGSGPGETPGVRVYGNSNVIDRNLIYANYGSGVMIEAGTTGNTITKNSIFQNGTISAANGSAASGGVGIDLIAASDNVSSGTSPFITPNSGALDATYANGRMNYPIFTSGVVVGSSLTVKGYIGTLPAGSPLFAGAKVEIFKSEIASGQNLGMVIVADGKSVQHGEGRTYLGTLIADANGLFSGTLTVTAANSLTSTDAITATATGTTAATLNSTSEFSPNCGFGSSIAGTVFEDVNYGGGAGRNFSVATTSAGALAPIGRPNVTVELYDKNGAFVVSATTDSLGKYQFPCSQSLAPYTVRVVNSTVTSGRPGAVAGLLPVQTFRTDVSGATVADDPNRVGGENPKLTDSLANPGLATLASLTAGNLTPESISTAPAGATGVDFGFNFDTIVNTNDSGQGSLRQFILNSNTLTNANLAQVGQSATQEVSIFMIPDGSASPKPGLRSGLATGINGTGANANAAVIVPLTALPSVTDSGTSIDGSTQTTYVGDSNSGTVGTGGTVGVSALALSLIPRPEIVVDFRTLPVNTTGFILQGANEVMKGLALFGTSDTTGSGLPSPSLIDINGLTSTSQASLSQLIVGAAADGSEIATGRIQVGITDNRGFISLTNSYLAYMASAVEIRPGVNNVADNNLIQNNELANNGAFYGGGAWDQISITVDQSGASSVGNTIKGNYIHDSKLGLSFGTQDTGIELIGANSRATLDNNTIDKTGVAGVALYTGTHDNTISQNIIRNVQSETFGALTGSGAGILIETFSSLTPLRNKITQNSTYGNAGPSIDLAVNSGSPLGDGVTPNNGSVSATVPNNGMDYPVFTSVGLAGTALTVKGYIGKPGSTIPFANAVIEIFKADDDKNQNGAVLLGDGQNVAHGEGRTYLGFLKADANGNFSGTITVPTAAGLTLADSVTATATDGVGNTSEFNGNCPLSNQPLISGTVFEDINYGGGAGRRLSIADASATASGFSAGAVGRPNVTVELFDSSGNLVTATTTDATGKYSFKIESPDTFVVRVANATIRSARTGATGAEIPVQTYRTDAASGTAADVLDRVGGENPQLSDSVVSAVGGKLSALTTASTLPESVTTVKFAATAISGVDFGFNFDTIVNTNDAGQGSLRQFILNSVALHDESKLAQSGNRKDLASSNQALPTRQETSIFMISDGAAHPGLRAGLANQFTGTLGTNARAVITVSSAQLPTVSDPNTIIDGTTQTVNGGDVNPQKFGYSGPVGTGADGVVGTLDDLSINSLPAPEIEIVDAANAITGLRFSANFTQARGLSIYGFGTDSSGPGENSNIEFTGSTDFVTELCAVGFSSASFVSPPAAQLTNGCGIDLYASSSNVTLQNNLIAYNGTSGIYADLGDVLQDAQNFQQ